MMVFSIWFWGTDILVSFNTACTVEGNLVTSRLSDAREYMSSWFRIDSVLLALVFALFTLPPDTGLIVVRNARAFRMLMLLRAQLSDAVSFLPSSCGRFLGHGRWAIFAGSFAVLSGNLVSVPSCRPCQRQAVDRHYVSSSRKRMS